MTGSNLIAPPVHVLAMVQRTEDEHVIGIRTLATQRNALIALVRHLAGDRTGGTLGAAITMLVKVLKLRGAIAYRVERGELVMVAEKNLPRRAKPWIAHLQLSQDPWFVAQHAAATLRCVRDNDTNDAGRQNQSFRPALEAEGWNALAAAPIAVARQLEGVLVVAAREHEALTKDDLAIVETVASLLGLALTTEKAAPDSSREDKRAALETARLATMGLLASAAARELSAPLGAIDIQLEAFEAVILDIQALVIGLSSVGEELGHATTELTTLQQDLVTSLAEAKRVAKRLARVSEESPPRPVDVVELVQRVAKTVDRDFQRREIDLDVASAEPSLRIDGRPEDLHHLLAQLAFYGAENATAEPGRRPRVMFWTLRHEETVVIEIALSGMGGQRTNDQVFDRLVRSQSIAQSGIALEVAKETAIAHRGHIELGTSELGGELIRLVFPESSSVDSLNSTEIAQRPPVPAPRSSKPRRQSTSEQPRDDAPSVLWVAPEESPVLLSAQRCLLAFDWVHVKSLAAAQQFVQEGPAPAFVFCDVVLPDGDAPTLHRSLAHLDDTQFAFMTAGVVTSDVANYLRNAADAQTLIKPVSLGEIMAVLEEDTMVHSEAPTLSRQLDSAAPPSDGAGSDSQRNASDAGKHPPAGADTAPGELAPEVAPEKPHTPTLPPRQDDASKSWRPPAD